jgi:uncharacterized protein (TIGR03086 family)
MAQQARPNPIELYKSAAQKTRQTLSGVKPDQKSNSTPCTDWNVQALMDHIVAGTGFVQSVLAGSEPSAPASADPVAAYDAGVASVLEAASKPGLLEGNLTTPFGEMPGRAFLLSGFMDTMVHGWDLAKATNQDTVLDPSLVEVCFAAFNGQTDGLRQGGAIGPEVPVADSGSTQEKLLGILGRKS